MFCSRGGLYAVLLHVVVSGALWPVHADIHYVSPSGSNTDPYTSWATAARDIQSAVNAAEDGDEVHVAAGTYVLSSQVLVEKGVRIEGVSGAGSTVVDGNHATRCFYLDHADVELIGLTIRHGSAEEGAGIYADESRGLTACTIRDNTASSIMRSQGGGVYVDNPCVISNCTITGNTAGDGGGGIYARDAGTLVENCSITGNRLVSDRFCYGAGLWISDGTVVRNCTVSGNTASGNRSSGGGLYLSHGGLVEGCTVSGNTASGDRAYGGGLCLYYNGHVRGCTVVGNTATETHNYGGGGGIYIRYAGVVENSLIRGNSMSSHGGGVYIRYGPGDYDGGWLKNCTVADNSAGMENGGVHMVYGGRVQNSIVYYNTASLHPNCDPAFAGISTTCATPTPGGAGNLGGPPAFANRPGGNYRLGSGSPCMDTGAALAGVTPDLDGVPRPLDGNNSGGAQWDMGAYEYLHPSADSDGDGLSDVAETGTHGTNPTLPDTDGDGLNDYAEVITHLTDPHDPDHDDDGLTDGQEVLTYSTLPKDADSDDDGLSDGEEVLTNGSLPLDPDSDDDGVCDGPLDPDGSGLIVAGPDSVPLSDNDEDGDGLLNGEETSSGADGVVTDPWNADTDGDGVSDGPNDPGAPGSPVYAGPDAVPLSDNDQDGDDLSNLEETTPGLDGYLTNPLVPDTDGDDIPDGWESVEGTNPTLNDAGLDPDQDGLSHLEEHQHNCKPFLPDTDGDGHADGKEVVLGTSPTDPDDFPPLNLSAATVTPEMGHTGTLFRYEVRYRHEAGLPPTSITVVIDSLAGPLFLDASTATDHVYAAEARLEAGGHTYSFEAASTAGGYDRLPWSGVRTGPVVRTVPAFLEQGDVSPDSGTTGTLFRYEVAYRNLDDFAPDRAVVYIDGTPADMTLDSGQAHHGTYAYTTHLEAGFHHAWFSFVDPLGRTSRWPEAGMIARPTVGSALRYVSTAGSHTPPFDTWDTAATNIQSAVDLAPTGGLVLVGGGRYTGWTWVTNPVFLVGVDGAERCVIDGQGARQGIRIDASNAVLRGFTITNGDTASSGGGVYLNYGAVMEDCVVVNCEADNNGGGISALRNAVVRRTVVRNNVAMFGTLSDGGGGVYLNRSRAEQCTVVGNRATKGGGISGFLGEVVNSLVASNEATGYGGGVYGDGIGPFPGIQMVNATVIGNRSGSHAGGAYGVNVLNSIVYYNTAPLYPNARNCDFEHSATTPAASGPGNLSAEPMIASRHNPYLLPGSPCIDAGDDTLAEGEDIDGGARIRDAHVDIGCDEFVADDLTGGLTVTPLLPFAGFVAGQPVEVEAVISGRVEGIQWELGGEPVGEDLFLLHHPAAVPGPLPVSLVVSNREAVVETSLVVQVYAGYTNYVSGGGTATPPYTNWASAAHRIQDAVDAAETVKGATVVVTDGLYATGGRVAEGSLTSRVVVLGATEVRSVNGPEVTVIEGKGPVGDTAVRGVFLGEGALLEGFTVRGGATRTYTGVSSDHRGAGVYCRNNATVRRCILRDNASGQYGGGVAGGQVEACLITSNRAESGGGAYNSYLLHCTVVDNHAGTNWYDDAGGAYSCDGENTIIMFNTAGDDPNATWGYYDYCCLVADSYLGDGNITNDPLFVSMAAGDYRLSAASPCVDSGMVVTVTRDLTGIPMPLDGNNDGIARHDIGAYAFVHAGADTDQDQVPDVDEVSLHHSDPTRWDTDGDGAGDGEEVFADTSPLDPMDAFTIITLSHGSPFTAAIPCSTARVYTLRCSVDPVLNTWTTVTGAVNRPGHLTGTLLLQHTNPPPSACYRVTVGRP